jgi:CDP-2,3-bis-(O-geranylgeranyl)-sn-glycerol synthase
VLRDLGIAALMVLYLFAPLIPAVALAGLVMRFGLLDSLRRPIDGGMTLRGCRLFGDSKTWRGVVVAIVGCIAGAAAQKYVIGEAARPWMLVDYARINVVLFGLAMGAGAMLGELPNSFVKRQTGIAPGKTTRGPLAVLFYVWDQVDLLTTTWPLLTFWVHPTLRLVATSVLLVLAVHPTIALIGYLIGARRSAR